MSTQPQKKTAVSKVIVIIGVVGSVGLVAWLAYFGSSDTSDSAGSQNTTVGSGIPSERVYIDSSGFSAALTVLPTWSEDSSLDEIRELWQKPGYRQIERIDALISQPLLPPTEMSNLLIMKAMLLNYEGDPHAAYDRTGRGSGVV